MHLFFYFLQKKTSTIFCFLLVLCGRAGTDRSLSGESTKRKALDFQVWNFTDKASLRLTQGKRF